VDDSSARSPSTKVVALPVLRKVDRIKAQLEHTDAMQEVLVAIDTAIKEAEWSPDYQDQLAVRDERVFHQRFRFSVNRQQREQIIALKHEVDLTDKEIRILRSSVSLDFQNSKLKSTFLAAVTVWGYAQIVLIALIILIGTLGTVLAPHVSWLRIAGMLLLDVLLLLILIFVCETFIWPQRLRKRVQQSQRSKRS